jgi:hypothetical protein
VQVSSKRKVPVVVTADDQHPPVPQTSGRREGEVAADVADDGEATSTGVIPLDKPVAAGDEDRAVRECGHRVEDLEAPPAHRRHRPRRPRRRVIELSARVAAAEVGCARAADDEDATIAEGRRRQLVPRDSQLASRTEAATIGTPDLDTARNATVRARAAEDGDSAVAQEDGGVGLTRRRHRAGRGEGARRGVEDLG